MKVNHVHQCNLHCFAMDPTQIDSLGIKDSGKWLPFSIHMGIVVGCKMTSDEKDEPTYNCTTLYTEQGDSFIIDTPYVFFNQLFVAYNNEDDLPSSSSAPSSPAAEL